MMNQKFNLFERGDYLLHRMFWRAREKYSTYSPRKNTNNIAIIGAYYSSNVGDLSMGLTLQKYLENRFEASKNGGKGENVKNFYLVSHSNPPKNIFSHVICGGGELGDENYFRQVFKLAGNEPSRVSICGISPYCRLHEASTEIISKLADVPFISVRSKTSQNYLKGLLNRNDIMYHPDIAFSMPDVFGLNNLKKVHQTSKKSAKRVGINIIPFYCSISGKAGMISICQNSIKMFEKINPVFAKKMPLAVENYIEFTKKIVNKLSIIYDEVLLIPFSYADYLFSRNFMGRNNVKIVSYESSPVKLFQKVASCQSFFAARFHSHAFALLAGVPFISFQYSAKCTKLMEDLGVNKLIPSATREDLLRISSNELIDRLFFQTESIPYSVLKDVKEKSLLGLEKLSEEIKL